MEFKEWIITWLHLLLGAIIISIIVLVVMYYIYPAAVYAGIDIGSKL